MALTATCHPRQCIVCFLEAIMALPRTTRELGLIWKSLGLEGDNVAACVMCRDF